MKETLVDGCFGSPAPLSESEMDEWRELVEQGSVLRAEKARDKDAAAAVKLMEMHGGSSKYAPKKRKSRNRGIVANSLDNPSVGVIRWIILRHGGISPSKASEGSGCTWSQVIREYNHNEDVRCAVDAMHRDSRMLMIELAHGTHEQVLAGADIGGVNARAAEWTLERIGGGAFADPRVKSSASSSDSGSSGSGGGIVINVIGDAAALASKPIEKGKASVFIDA